MENPFAPQPKKRNQSPPVHNSFQRELEAKMKHRKKIGLATDVTPSESGQSADELGSDNELLAGFNMTNKSRSPSPRKSDFNGVGSYEKKKEVIFGKSALSDDSDEDGYGSLNNDLLKTKKTPMDLKSYMTRGKSSAKQNKGYEDEVDASVSHPSRYSKSSKPWQPPSFNKPTLIEQDDEQLKLDLNKTKHRPKSPKPGRKTPSDLDSITEEHELHLDEDLISPKVSSQNTKNRPTPKPRTSPYAEVKAKPRPKSPTTDIFSKGRSKSPLLQEEASDKFKRDKKSPESKKPASILDHLAEKPAEKKSGGKKEKTKYLTGDDSDDSIGDEFGRKDAVTRQTKYSTGSPLDRHNPAKQRYGHSKGEQDRKSPFEKDRKSPFDKDRKSPFEKDRKSPFEKDRKSPFDKDRKSPFDKDRKSPFEKDRKSPFDRRGEDEDRRQGAFTGDRELNRSFGDSLYGENKLDSFKKHYADKRNEQYGDRDKRDDRYGDRRDDRYGDKRDDRYGDRRDDRYGDRRDDRYGDRRDDRYGDKRDDRYGDKRDDRYGDKNGRDDRYGNRSKKDDRNSDKRDDRYGDRKESKAKEYNPFDRKDDDLQQRDEFYKGQGDDRYGDRYKDAREDRYRQDERRSPFGDGKSAFGEGRRLGYDDTDSKKRVGFDRPPSLKGEQRDRSDMFEGYDRPPSLSKDQHYDRHQRHRDQDFDDRVSRSPKRGSRKAEDRDSSLCRDVEADPSAMRKAETEEEQKLKKREVKAHTQQSRFLEHVIDSVKEEQQGFKPVDPDTQTKGEKKRSTSARHRPQPRYAKPVVESFPTRPATAIDPNDTVSIREAVFLEWYKERNEKAKKEKQEKLKEKEKEEEKKRKEEEEKNLESKASYNAWMEKKKETLIEKERKKRREERMKLREEESKHEKKQEAEKNFRKWKENKDEVIVEKKREEKRKEMEKKYDEEETKSQKEKEAKTAFRGWKEKKEERLKEEAYKKQQEIAQQKRQEKKKQKQRENEASRKYVEWMDKKSKDNPPTQRKRSSEYTGEELPPWKPASRTIPLGR